MRHQMKKIIIIVGIDWKYLILFKYIYAYKQTLNNNQFITATVIKNICYDCYFHFLFCSVKNNIVFIAAHADYLWKNINYF
jgi:hypothetical protein